MTISSKDKTDNLHLPSQIPIIRSAGLTESEQCLVDLAEKSFLNLWSYPNLYKQKGKELCDLLVVFGDHVLVFSDKTIAYPTTSDQNVNWKRWYRSAIKKSADQVKGAIRWLEKFPNEIYMDAACQNRFQLPLPPKDRRRITGIIVALGAKQPCLDFFKEGKGSLKIIPSLSDDSQPFSVGDINPHDSFIHLFDDVTLDIALKELDTITDFTAYLDKKESFLRSEYLKVVQGEENLLAAYISFTNSDGEHDFPAKHREEIPQGVYDELLTNPSYHLKLKANEDSYVWDKLITAFTTPIMNGTILGGHSLSEHEESVRYMAAESRVERRMLGRSVKEAIEKGKNLDRFGRRMLPGDSRKTGGTGYIFLTLAYPDIEPKGGYEQYRTARKTMLQAYCLSTYQENQHLKRIIGISTESHSSATTRKGSSEDLILFEPAQWTKELDEETNKLREFYDIGKQEDLKTNHIHEDEYPSLGENDIMMIMNGGEKIILFQEDDDEQSPSGLNRHQRRAAKSRKRRSGK